MQLFRQMSFSFHRTQLEICFETLLCSVFYLSLVFTIFEPKYSTSKNIKRHSGCFFYHTLMALVYLIYDAKGITPPVFPLKPLQTQELGPKTFWILVLTISSHSCKISRPYIVPASKIIELRLRVPLKVIGFSGQILMRFMKTSFIEMPELLNFGHMTSSTI